ncbi:ABC transporter ATP-binding protein [uncultured Enterovirga sp.]|uniref:ABC transporter ATP-binding protein n=1 Tax=uncultured Enterovirga sp. TaxID=2026352 RepID=UPI0035CB6366
MIRGTSIVKDYRVGHQTKRVLDHVNFEVRQGERLAVLGRNGAGKSTLVRIIGGVERPTSGRIDRQMSMSWPLGLAGGFQGSLTGYDNVKFIARVYDKAFAEIKEFVEDFSELGNHLKAPVRTYSSGMRARLAFGLSLAIDFDCYLVDEVIFVGDQKFHARCRYEIFEKRPDRALLLVSHDFGIIKEYCNGAMVLHQGRAKTFFDVQLGIDIYAGL